MCISIVILYIRGGIAFQPELLIGEVIVLPYSLAHTRALRRISPVKHTLFVWSEVNDLNLSTLMDRLRSVCTMPK